MKDFKRLRLKTDFSYFVALGQAIDGTSAPAADGTTK